MVRKYYAYRATVSAGFYLPVSVVYLTRQGLGLGEIGVVQAVFLFALVLAEVPTGYLGDRLGRRTGLAFGNALTAAVMGGFVVAETTVGFAVVYAVWAVAWTFRSGTAAAWLYELLTTVGRAGDYTRISGRAEAVLAVTSALTALGGGALFTVAPAAPFLANAALAALGIPILFTLPETNGEGANNDQTDADRTDADRTNADRTDTDRTDTDWTDADRTDADRTNADRTDDGVGRDAANETNEEIDESETNDDDPLTVRAALGVLRAQAGRTDVRWLVVYAALFNVAFSVSRVFEQPAARSVGVSIAGLGVMYAVFKLCSAGASALAGPVEDRLGRRRTLLALLPAYGLAYGVVGLAPVALLPALVLNRSLHSLTTPVRNGYLNDRLENVGRATVLSGVSMVLSVASGTANAVGGQIAARIGPVTFLWTATVGVVLLAGVVWLATDPVRSQTTTTDGVPAD